MFKVLSRWLLCTGGVKCLQVAIFAAILSTSQNLRATLFDGGVDSANLGKGEWIYVLSSAVNHFSDPGMGPYAQDVVDVPSMMSYMKNTLHMQFVVVKAASGAALFAPQGSPQFTSSVVNSAHAVGLKIFGYTLSEGANVPGETTVADYVFNCGADGFILDAEDKWETLANNRNLAWQLCGAIKTNWPTKFLAHSPFANYNSHTAFPYKEFGYWCDAVMPQVYWYQWGVSIYPSANPYSTPVLGIQWTDSNFASFQNGLASQGQTPPTFKHPSGASWTNAIKPLAPIAQAYVPGATNQTYADMTNFVNYLKIDPTCVTAGGYKGCSFFRAGLEDTQMLQGISVAKIGNFGAPTTTTVTVSPSPSYGYPFTLTAMVTGDGIPTGVVSFYRQNNLLGTANLNASGVASLVVSNYLHASDSPYSLTAYYEGSPNLNPSTSDIVTLDISFTDPTVTFTTSPNPSVEGAPITVIATIVGTPFVKPTGLVEFFDGDIDLGTVELDSSGKAQITAAASFPSWDSPHPFSGYYYGDAGYNPMNFGLQQWVMDPPAITTQPDSLIKLGGSSASFTVGVSGTPPFYYHWFKNGNNPLPGADDTLNLSSLRRSDSGAYSVVISNLVGSVVSDFANLTVHVPQHFNSPTLLPDGSIMLTASDSDGGSLSAADLSNIQVEASTDLVKWTPVTDALTITNGTISLQTAGATNDVMHFYRVIESW